MQGFRGIGCALLMAMLAGMPSPALGARTGQPSILQAFTYPSQESAEQAWRPSPSSPRVVREVDGLRFQVPFANSAINRVYWDHKVSLDLSDYSSFEFDLSCDDPRALKTLALYFKSGDGWYIWNKPLLKAGRHILTILKGDFEAEGKPAGWNRIELIRISPWKGAPVSTSITAHQFTTRQDTLMLVRGTLSTQDAVARGVSKRVTERLSGWLASMGITHGVVDDEAVERGALNRAGVAILCYNPHPSAAEISALRSFLQRGGKLIVFYGSSPELASLFHCKIGSYTRAQKAGQWSSFTFEKPAEWNVPERVFQESPNLVPVYPADSSARVIAWWEDASGRRLREPAWVASGQGFWMSHILMNDDIQNKKDLLLGLLSKLDPALCGASAQRCMAYAGKIDSFKSFAEASSVLSIQARGASEPRRVAGVLNQAARTFALMQARFVEGDYTEVIRLDREIRANMIEAYALVQPTKPGEFRGVWDHEGMGWFPGNWDRTCEILEENGLTAVFPNLVWGGLAHYPSRQLPVSATCRALGDQLAACVKAAHRHGLQVHVWVVCWRLDNAPAAWVEQMRKEGRLQATADGKPVPWLDPAHPANVELALAVLREIAELYAVDGIHLDYIRYPDATLSFSPAARAAFERALGHKADGWPRSAQAGGKYASDFKQWRAEVITAFIRAAREQTKAINPKIKLSAAVFGSYPDCISSIGQDWGGWLKNGIVDFVCPMSYTAEAGTFSSLTARHLALPGARGRVYPGIGITADESQLAPDQVIEQIGILRKLGATGFMLFDLSQSLRGEVLPLLRLGVTRP